MTAADVVSVLGLEIGVAVLILGTMEALRRKAGVRVPVS